MAVDRLRVLVGVVLAVGMWSCPWASAGPSEPASALAEQAKAPPEPPQAPASAPSVEMSAEGCRIETFAVPSASMKRDIRAVVVLPPGYDPNGERRYPVLYALHGMGAPYAAWSDMPPLRRALKDMPMIVASFDGDRAGWYIDATTRPDSQFTTFFFREFLPLVEARCRGDGRRGVTGFSMGGYGAFHYMLARPEMFASVSSLSGAFDMFGETSGKPNGSLQPLLGDFQANKEAYLACGILGRLRKAVADGKTLPPMRIHCGTEDGLLKANRDLRDLLVELNGQVRKRLEAGATGPADPAQRRREITERMAREGLRFQYVESPGGHDWPFWRDASRGVIEFHWRHFQDRK